MSDKLALIDLSGVFYNAYYSVGADARPDAAVQSAYRAVHALATRWTFVAICADAGKSFRADITPSYKAQRKEKDAPMMAQLDRLIQKLEADGFPVWRAAGFEADDVIASATMAAYDKGVPVVIVTQDKDLWQLVDDDAGVSILSLPKDLPVKSADVLAKFGVSAGQMGDFLALVGDVSDNIQGAKGIGEKTAAKLLSARTLPQVIDDAKTGKLVEFSDHIRQKLITCEADIELARQLVTLRTDVAIDLEAAFLPRVKTAIPTHEDAMSEPLDTETATPLGPRPVPEPQAAPPQPAPEPTAVAIRATTALEDAAPTAATFEHQLEPRSPRDAVTMAKWIFESNLYRKFESPQAIFSVMLAGRELGLSAMASLRAFHVVEGSPTLAADLIRALVLQSGKAEYFTPIDRTDTESTWETKRKGDPHPVRVTYTIAEAAEAKLLRAGSGWEKHRKDMLAKTASSKLARLIYPDVTFGLYSPEELGGEAA